MQQIKSQKNEDMTFVSAFLNLSSKEENSVKRSRSGEDYMRYGKYVLSLPYNLVLFMDKDYAVEAQVIRTGMGLEEKTKIIAIDLEDLPYFEKLEKIQACRQMNPLQNGDPNKDTSLFTLMTWCKIPFVCKAIEANYFNTRNDLFAWIDFGIAHVAIVNIQEKDGLLTNAPHDKMKLLSLRPLYISDITTEFSSLTNIDQAISVDFKHYFSHERGIVAAGFMTGGAKVWKLFQMLFDKLLDLALQNNIAPSEQQIYPLIMKNNMKMFEPYRGDYKEIICNYRFFRTGIDNIVKYTMQRARWEGEQCGNPHLYLGISSVIGIEILNQLMTNGYKLGLSGAEDYKWVLIFLNELYYAFIQTKHYDHAEKLRVIYQDFKQDQNCIPYLHEIEEMIPN